MTWAFVACEWRERAVIFTDGALLDEDAPIDGGGKDIGYSDSNAGMSLADDAGSSTDLVGRDDAASSSAHALDALAGADVLPVGMSLLGHEPMAGAAVDPMFKVRLHFSRTLECSTVTDSSIRVKQNTSIVAGSLFCQDSIVEFQPLKPAVLLSQITVHVSSALLRSRRGETLEADEMFAFAVRDGRWTSEKFDNGSMTNEMRLASNGSGVAVATWQAQVDGGKYHLRYRRHRQGTWSSENVSLLGESAQTFPMLADIAVDDAGNAVIVWFSRDTTYRTEHPVAGEMVVRPAAPYVTSPRIVSLGPLNFFFAYVAKGASVHVFVGEKVSDPSWAGDMSLAGRNPSLLSAVWAETPYGGTPVIKGIGASQSESRVPRVIGPATSADVQPVLTMTENGDSLAAWTHRDVGVLRVFVALHEVEKGDWSPSRTLSTTDGDAKNVALATDGRGSFMAVWEQAQSGKSHIVVARSDRDAMTWSAPILLSSGVGVAANPQVAMDSAGNALVLWEETNGAEGHVYSARFVVGDGWQPRSLRSDGRATAHGPRVVLDDNGIGFAGWTQNSGSVLARFK